jgi:hypothetical protein
LNGRGPDTWRSAVSGSDPRNHADFIWSVAHLLRGDYKHSEYGKVILPLTVLRRLDRVFAPTKQQVLGKHKQLRRRLETMDPVINLRGSVLGGSASAQAGSPSARNWPFDRVRRASTALGRRYALVATEAHGCPVWGYGGILSRRVSALDLRCGEFWLEGARRLL